MTNDALPTPDLPLLRKAVDWARHEASKPKETREWEQATWVTTPRARAHAQAISELHAQYTIDVSKFPPGDRAREDRYSQYRRDVKNRTDELLAVTECGTAYCIAGYVGYITDYEFQYVYDSDTDYETHKIQGFVDISDYARETLGVTKLEANSLFAAYNKIEDVERVADAIAARAGEKL